MRSFFSVAAVTVLSGCGDPSSIRDLDPARIQSVVAEGENLIVSAQVEPGPVKGAAMLDIGDLIETVARGFQEGVPGPTEATRTVQLALTIPAHDRLGQPIMVDFGTIALPADDLRKANIENLSGSAWLELVDSIAPAEGASLAIEYCADRETYELHPEWCGALTEGLGL